MSPGQFARALLGNHFEPLGNAYRRFFVDLNLVADFITQELPTGARLLDIGGGDGALVERLLNRRPDLSITMCDLAPSIGQFLSPSNKERVVLLPAREFVDVEGRYDAVTICDVIHHVPVPARNSFFEDLRKSCEKWGCSRIILKDIEPGELRATISLLADRYITGDRHVVLFSRVAFGELATAHFAHASRKSVMVDRPNYGEVLSW